ncbi:MAG: hypothetical protein HPY62_02895 [Bacteroidales bacterium]|nr:hypothetical protein [Bacteroidales bacterium]
MKLLSNCLLIILSSASVIFISSCGGGSPDKKAGGQKSDTLTVADTGYTGVKKYYSGTRLVKEVTFRNGIRHGETRTYYQGGQLYQRFWYENDLREDSAKWYYLEGQVFRSTPYRHDTIDGIQMQYYRSGRVKAKIGYKKGLRTPFFQEFTQDGKLVTGYPEIVASVNDEYATKGQVRINLELSDKSEKVKFFRGEFTNGVFDTAQCKPLNTVKGKAYINLKKSKPPQPNYVSVIAEIITGFGNRYLTEKKIDLPYNDLN